MKIIRVGFKNINSLNLEESVDFGSSPLADAGLFAIVGDTGSGKTTLLDAITLALYGKVARDASPGDLMSFGTADSYAEVDFETAKGAFRSKWSIWRANGKPDGKLQSPKRELSKWNNRKNEYEIIAEKISEVNSKVEEVSGLDYVRFTKSVLLSQGDFAAFLKSKENERSDLLERITGTEIYTQLSKAAFGKKREEEALLSHLEMKRDARKALNPEEVEILKKEIKGFSNQQKELTSELENQKSVLTALESFEKFEILNRKNGIKKEELDKEKEALKDDFEKLKLHRILRPIAPDLVLLDEGLKKQVEIVNELNSLIDSSLEVEQFLEKISNEITETEENSNELQKKDKIKKKIFEETIELDFQLGKLEKPLKENAVFRRKLNLEIEKSTATLKAIEQDKLGLERNKERISVWLMENKKLETLPQKLSSIITLRDGLRTVYGSVSNFEKEKASLSEQLTGFEKLKDEAFDKIQEIKVEEKKIETELKKIIPGKFASSPSELLGLVNNEIEEMSEKANHLRQLLLLTTDYKKMLAEFDENEQKLEELKNRDSLIKAQLLTALEMVEELKKRLEYKQAIFDRERLLAGYSEARENLKEGEQCPLCFSTEHRLELHKAKPYVNEAGEELKTVKLQYENVLNQYRGLLNSQQEIQLRIEQLVGFENQELNGQIQSQFAKILDFEKRFSSISANIDSDLFLLSHSLLVNEKVEEFEIAVVKRKAIREKISTFETDIKRLADEKITCENEVRKIENNCLILKEKIKNLELRNRDSESEKKSKIEELNKALQPFGFEFKEESAKDMFHDLENSKVNYEKNEKELNDVSNSLIIKEKELEQVSASIVKLEKELKDFDQNRSELNEEFIELKKKRTELLEDKDPRIEREEWNAVIISNRELLLQKNKKKEELKLSFQTIKTTEKNLQKQKSETALLISKTEVKVAKKAEKLGFTDMDSLRNVLLAEPIAEKLEELERIIERKEIEIANDKKSIQNSLKELRPKIEQAAPKEELKKAVFELSAKNEDLLKDLGGRKQKLDHHLAVEKEIKELLKSISKQKKSLNKWSRLSDLIGSSDGKKFRAFAQGLTLEKLTQLANIHLERLNGRYLIMKRDTDNLDLEIVDTYQADNVRSMNTLSGGETFLVSLSLALGLSDLAGRNTRIESLFIDEGFGTLDQATLDTAISSLENLQSTGKTIGIISHVPQLKERISTQIRLVKKGSGFSELEIV